MDKIQVGHDLIIDRQHKSVVKNGAEIRLPALSYRLLLVLVENAPEIVSHDNLIKAVWRQRIVSDENLKQRISRLKRALLVSGDHPGYIVAERGMGYRCIAPVTQLTLPEPELLPIAGAAPGISEQTKPFSALLSAKGLIIFGLGCLVALVALVSELSYNQHDSRLALQQAKFAEFTASDYNQQATQYYYRFKPGANHTAISLYQRAIETDPGFAQAYAGLANAYTQGYYQYGQDLKWLALSVDYSNQAIALQPGQPWGYKSLGLALHLQGQFTQALLAYQQASRLAPWWAGPVNNSALVHLESGRLVLAYKDAIKAINLDRKDPIPYLFLGLSYQGLGMAQQALQAMHKSIALKPDYLLAHNYLAQLYISLGEHDKAQALLRQTLAQASNNQFGHWLVAQSFLQQGKLTAAKSSFEQVVQLGGRYQLTAKIKIALLDKNKLALVQLKDLVEQQINAANQWPTLLYDQALILFSQQQSSAAMSSLNKAIDAGFGHYNPFWQSPLMQALAQSDVDKIKVVVSRLALKTQKQRQQVRQLQQAQGHDFL
jgi:DNA-binding winged helix-turn-helix (wHTH) protein/lipoprotein NlpI